jgi:hypothetical protein
LDTGCEEEKDGSIYKLADHPVSCPVNSAIAYSQLYWANSEMKYNFSCVTSTNITTTCSDYNTNRSGISASGASASAGSLRHHNISCPSNTVLTAFRLNKYEDESKINYTYTCCNATNIKSTGSGQGEVRSLGTENVQSLSQSQFGVTLNTWSVFTRWQLTRQNDGRYRINYSFLNFN